MYRKFGKRMIDILLSAFALIILAIPMIIIAIAVKFSSKGTVLFWQKRVGCKKEPFIMPKFRSMYTDTPSDMPTHLLNDPTHWITPIGAFLRKSSLDELPQLWCILIGNMSIVGPRPALWNQDDLIAERDKYGANDIRPGLTGWAQINGRDELPIEVKAKLDGEYSATMKKGGWTAFVMDCRCFFETIGKVLNHDGVVEGGTGAINTTEDENTTKEPVHK